MKANLSEGSFTTDGGIAEAIHAAISIIMQEYLGLQHSEVKEPITFPAPPEPILHQIAFKPIRPHQFLTLHLHLQR